MTFRTLVIALYRAGVTYWATPAGTLGYRAPHGLTGDLRAAMKAHKPELLALCAGGVTVFGKGAEPVEEWARLDAEQAAQESEETTSALVEVA